MRRGEDHAGFNCIISIFLPHFEEVSGYLCEKSFVESLTWIPSKKMGQISVEVPNISKEF